MGEVRADRREENGGVGYVIVAIRGDEMQRNKLEILVEVRGELRQGEAKG